MKTFMQFVGSPLCEEIQMETDVVQQKIDELTKACYALNCSRERRIDGYTRFPGSSRKFRFKRTDDGQSFYIEVVNVSDESFVADIGGCMQKTIDELISLIKEY